MKKGSWLFEILFIMVGLQGLLGILKLSFGAVLGQELFQRKMSTMCAMILLTLGVMGYTKWRKIKVSVVPHPFTAKYVMATIMAALLLVATPSNFTGNFRTILLLLYGSIVTPIFEELLFRGVFWSKLESVFQKETVVFVVDAILFSIWHLGYVFSNLLEGDWFAVITKLAVGLFYGLILGVVRVKTKNCYATMLLHGALNAFH